MNHKYIFLTLVCLLFAGAAYAVDNSLSNKIDKLSLAFDLDQVNLELSKAEMDITGVIALYKQKNMPTADYEQALQNIQTAKAQLNSMKSLVAGANDVTQLKAEMTTSVTSLRRSIVSAVKKIDGLDGSELNAINYIPGQVIVKLKSDCTMNQVQQAIAPKTANLMTGNLIASTDYTNDVVQAIQQTMPQAVVQNPDSFDRANGLDRTYTIDSSALQQKGQDYLSNDVIIDNTVQSYEIATPEGTETLQSVNPIDPYTLDLYQKYKSQSCIEEAGLIPVTRLADANYNTKTTAAKTPDSVPASGFFSNLADKFNALTGMAANKITGMVAAVGACQGTPDAQLFCSIFSPDDCSKITRCQWNAQTQNCDDKRGNQQSLACSELGKDICLNYNGCYISCQSDSDCSSNSVCNAATNHCDLYTDIAPNGIPIKEMTLDRSGETIKLKNKVYDFDLRTKDSYSRDTNTFGINLAGDRMVFDCNGATLNLKYSSYLGASRVDSPVGAIVKSTGNNNELRNCNFILKITGALSTEPAAITSSAPIKIKASTFALQNSFGIVATAAADVSGSTFTGTQTGGDFSGTAILVDTTSGTTAIHDNSFLNNDISIKSPAGTIDVESNTFGKGNFGIALLSDSTNENRQIKANTFTDLNSPVVADDTTVTANKFMNFFYGITGNGNSIFSNQFSNGAVAIAGPSFTEMIKVSTSTQDKRSIVDSSSSDTITNNNFDAVSIAARIGDGSKVFSNTMSNPKIDARVSSGLSSYKISGTDKLATADPLAQIQVVDFTDTNEGTPTAVEIHDNTLKGTGTGSGLFFRVDSQAESDIYSNTIDDFQTGINMALNNGELAMADNVVSNSAVGLDAMQTGSYADAASTGTLNMVDNDLCSNKNDFNCKNIPNYLISGLACDKMTSGAGCGNAVCHLTCAQTRNAVSVYALNADDPAKLTDAGSLLSLAKIRHSQEQAQQVKLTLQSSSLSKTEYDMTPASTQSNLPPGEQNNVYQLDLSKFPKGTYSGDIVASFNSGPVGTTSIQFSWTPPEKAGPVEIKLPYGSTGSCEKYPGDPTDYSSDTCDINDAGNSGPSLDFNAIENGYSPGELKSCTFSKADDALFTLKLNEDPSKKYDIYVNDVLIDSMYGGQQKEMHSYLFYKAQPDANTVSLVYMDPLTHATDLITFDVYANYIDPIWFTVSPIRPSTFFNDFLFYKPSKPYYDGTRSEYFAFKTNKKVKDVYVMFETDTGMLQIKLDPTKTDTNYNYYSVLPSWIKDPNDPFKDIIKGYIFVTDMQGNAIYQQFEIRLSEIHDWALESYGESYTLDGATIYASSDPKTDPDINYFEATKYDFGMGDGANIAVVDTGIDDTNPYLKNKVKSGIDFEDEYGTTYVSTKDIDGHGTEVSGIIASDKIENEFTGIAPKATLYSYNLIALKRPNGIDICRIIDDIIKNNKEISITTNSWQSHDYKSDLYSNLYSYKFYAEEMRHCFEKAKENNILSFAASGNCGGEHAINSAGGKCFDTFGIENGLPTAFDGPVQTIGGITLDNKLYYTDTSASMIDGYSDRVTDGHGKWSTKWFDPTTNVLDYVLPEIYSSWIVSSQTHTSCTANSKTGCLEKGYSSGTSFSAPVATAIAAVIISNCNTKLTPDQITDIMDHGADSNVKIDRPESSGPAKDYPEYYVGKGKIKLDKALEYMYTDYKYRGCVS